MRYTIPHYYRQFRCTASECEDTCCAGWEIKIDGRSLKRYQDLEGPFGSRLYNSIDWEEQSFRQYKRRCAFLNEDNLCDIYAEAGQGMLCKTCRLYPRHVEEFEGIREISLSLSCMEAAELILGCKEPVRFLHKEDDKEEEYPEFDFFLFTKLEDCRELMLQILQNRGIKFPVRMSICLALSSDLQHRIDRDRLYRADELLSRYASRKVFPYFSHKLEGYIVDAGQRFYKMKEMLEGLSALESLRDGWPGELAHAKEVLYGRGMEHYSDACEEFHRTLGYGGSGECSRYGEQLMVYFVYVYFCGAVYDGRAYAKICLAVVSTLVILELAMAAWMERRETLAFEDIADIAHRYSREVEHSDSNLKRLEKMFLQEKRFELENLLQIIQ